MVLVVVCKAHLLVGILPVVVQEKASDLYGDSLWVMRIHLLRPGNPGDLEKDGSVVNCLSL